jgi:hypothetical protein
MNGENASRFQHLWEGSELEVSRMNDSGEQQGEVCLEHKRRNRNSSTISAMQRLFLANPQTGNALEKSGCLAYPWRAKRQTGRARER